MIDQQTNNQDFEVLSMQCFRHVAGGYLGPEQNAPDFPCGL